MKTIYDYIKEASLLGDIDDVLSDGDEYAKRYETFGFKYKLKMYFQMEMNMLKDMKHLASSTN